jgi:trimeric autotransporter adhesin
MKAVTSLLALTLLAIVLASPALAGDVDAAKTCKPGSTKGNCLLALITTLQGQVAALQTALSTANTSITTLQTALTTVQNNHALALGPFVSVDPGAENGLAGPNIIFSGANVHIESGSGNTFDLTGLGNLVIGYDEDSLGASTIDANRTGSNNLVVGADHQFTASGGAVMGVANFISTNADSVTGGICNDAGATAFPASLTSLCTPAFIGNIDSVGGGVLNWAHGGGSSVSGGFTNTASGEYSSVSGGDNNNASGEDASVSGGNGNTASQTEASVSGGQSNTASGDQSSVSGGFGNTASGGAASVSGGDTNTASILDASVSGGENNTASGEYSSILGGDGVSVSTTWGISP